MILVLLWLSSAAFLALVLSLHAGVQSVRLARRVRYGWAVAAVIALVSVWVEGLEGPNTGDDPIALVPRLVKWGWYAGVLVALRHPIRWAALPLLLVGQVATVSFILGPAEAAAATDPGAHVAWALDKATLLEAVVREAFDALWGGRLPFPSDAVLGYLGTVAPYFLPLALGLFVAFTLALLRGVTAATGWLPPGPDERLPALTPRPLGPWVFLTLVVAALPLDALGVGGAWAADLARLVWLSHLFATLRQLWGAAADTSAAPLGTAWARWPGRPGTGLVVLALCVLPDVVGPVLGAAGVALARAARPGGGSEAPALGFLVGWRSLAFAALLYGVLRSVDLEPANPQAPAEHPTATWPAGQARSAQAAVAACRAQRAQLGSLVSWRASHATPRGGEGDWQWVRVPSAGGSLVGLVRGTPALRPSEGGGVFVVAGAYHDAVGAPAAGVRCSRSGP